MSWTRLTGTFHGSPKINRLARALEIKPVQARGHLATLWSWCQVHAPDGFLGPFEDADIETACEWEGEPGRFVSCAIACKFFDKTESGLAIHDWFDHAKGWLEAERSRERRGRDRYATGTRPGRDQDATGTRPGRDQDATENDRVASWREERRGEEKRGEERRREDQKDIHVELAPPAADASPPQEAADRVPSVDIDKVVQHYQTHHPRSRPGQKERALISRRLKEGYSPEDLCRAIDGCHASPFHCGENDRGQKYLDLGLIVRDSSHVAKFLELADSEPPWPRDLPPLRRPPPKQTTAAPTCDARISHDVDSGRTIDAQGDLRTTSYASAPPGASCEDLPPLIRPPPRREAQPQPVLLVEGDEEDERAAESSGALALKQRDTLYLGRGRDC